VTIHKINWQQAFTAQFSQTGPDSSKARVRYDTSRVYKNRPRSVFVDLKFLGNKTVIVNGQSRTIPAGEARNDIRPDWGLTGLNWQPGSEFWTGIAVYIATPFPTDSDAESIFDIHQSNFEQTAGSGFTGPTPFQIIITGSRYNTRAKRPPPGPWEPGIPTNQYSTYDMYDGSILPDLNTWTTHIVHYRVADHNNASFGLIEYYRNGVKQEVDGPVTGQNFYGRSDGGRGFYIKGGWYKAGWRPENHKPPYTGPVTLRTIYFGEWILGTSTESLTSVKAALDETGSGPGPDPDPEPCPAGQHLENGVCVPDTPDPDPDPGSTVLTQVDQRARVVPLRNINEAHHRYTIAETLNELNNKAALRGSMEFEAGSTFSIIQHPRILNSSTIILQPLTPNAGAAMAGLTITKEAGAIRITHASSTQEDRVFDYTIYP